jgi:hypothetical protein
MTNAMQHFQYSLAVTVSCDSCHEQWRETNNKPTWLTSYNFLCLLSLPKTIEEFGPIRNYWEGGAMGEKLIQVVKPLWNGFRKIGR